MAWLYVDYHNLHINQRMNLKMPATIFKTILAPSRAGRLDCRGAMRVPTEGSDELHWARGVRTATVQLVDNKFVSSPVEGFLNCMRNDPREFVIALEITVAPHCSCALASAQIHLTTYIIEMWYMCRHFYTVVKVLLWKNCSKEKKTFGDKFRGAPY